MRFITFAREGSTSWGIVQGERVVDVPALARLAGEAVPGDLPGFIAAAPATQDQVHRLIKRADTFPNASIALGQVRLLAPIARPPKNVFCLGRNYAEHAIEGARARGIEVKLPEKPIYFTKAATALIGPDEPIRWDGQLSQQYDWEVELAVVIGPGGRNIPRERALEHVFGYTILNDISAREVQRERGGQWFLGKNLDGSSPVGPWIVSADEIPDPQVLDVECRINGVVKQHANTRTMIFDVATTIADLSKFMTLEPGDIISTGTPEGVGFARTPPEYLWPGDVVESEVQGIGVLRNPVAKE